MRFETLAVHAGREVETGAGRPAHLTTFERDEKSAPLGGHTYIRESATRCSRSSRTRSIRLEGGEAALVLGSAGVAGPLQAFPKGAHVGCPTIRLEGG